MNLMPYSLYKNLGGMDEELIKTSMTINGVVGREPISAKAVTPLELITIGSKTFMLALFLLYRCNKTTSWT